MQSQAVSQLLQFHYISVQCNSYVKNIDPCRLDKSRLLENGDQYIVNLFSNRVTGVYEVTLCHVADNGSPG